MPPLLTLVTSRPPGVVTWTPPTWREPVVPPPPPPRRPPATSSATRSVSTRANTQAGIMNLLILCSSGWLLGLLALDARDAHRGDVVDRLAVHRPLHRLEGEGVVVDARQDV